MDRLQGMRVFVRVAESGGFAGAARALSMSPAAVTRAVAALEAVIGARLFIRTTRSVKLTEAGGRYLEDCRRILAEIAEAEAAAAGSTATPTGVLTLTAPVQFGRLYVLPVVTDYLTRHPAVTVRALFLDRIVNLIEEGIDVGVRIGHLADSGLTATRVGSVRRVVCAAPSYLERHGVPETPRDLRDHAVIGASNPGTLPEWRFGPEGRTTVGVHARLVCNTVDAALAAALDGWGIARLLSYQVASAVAEGRLRILLTDDEEAPVPIHVVSPGGRRAPAKTRAFVDLAAARLRADPRVNPAA
ncbi:MULTISPECIES: LysR family transcriptional regulator [Methylorubrum]|jgi:DNA-binding transcriptional LysR family regulator|uniref:Transcriptional regulator, LysR family n=2 Tax=Methylorubrum extorquens TaxID=408 RepID=C5AST2_METEA|nr:MULTISPECIES: LysR family transcriptional regulator [Methylorubrum]ACS42545.1 transcriptional regulator, LysR family [Methylorubrum extorquens AM1]EHP90765.1 transcriptional regulator, LysR family [Methylorubrum extorquens DSM 13060]MCP1544385.1 DNA-binding transcriptional LysR family regulator [Methylorubrum extorquens]MCP1588270.1 DNA-binding transcriptional LysR family regulator [Methylorubrum extorquens]BDL42020.1 LysR family transcriptional regulator [Methylorubrum sp. GM97]